MTQDQWYFSRDGEEKQGPHSDEELRQWVGAGHLPEETLVWRPGMDDWTPVQYVEELRSTGAPPPLPTDSQAVGITDESDTQRLLAAGKQVKDALSPKSVVNLAASKIFWFCVVAPLILFKMLILPAIVSSAAATVAEGYGIEMSVDDWSSSLFNLSATAHDTVIQVSGPYAEEELLSAEAIEIDLSLWGRIVRGKWVQEIRVKEPKLYVERLLSGRWNYEDVMTLPLSMTPDAPDASVMLASSSNEEELEGAFTLAELTIENMGLQWVENLPGDSRGGLIQDVTTTLFVDDISVDAKNLVGLMDLSGQGDSRLNLDARTGGGKISFNGQGNLFYWAASQEQSDTLAWMPVLKGKIYLENVGANAFTRLTPDASILPEGGTLSGSIEFALAEKQIDCSANLNMRDVTFTVNPTSRFVTGEASSVSADLSGYRANGPHQFSCGGRLGQGYRPFHAFQTNVIRQGVDQAPAEVRALAAVEHVRYSEDNIDPGLEAEIERIVGRVDPTWLKVAGLVIEETDSSSPGFFRKWKRRIGL